MPKIEPAVTQLLYIVPNGDSYIDIAKDLSRVNRRLYRQGMTYVVQDIQIAQTAGLRPSDISQLSFNTMGNSWMVHNAWRKGFKTWQKMQNDFMDGAGARLKGKWADFKIYLDDSQAGGTTLEPYAGDGAVYTAGEWVPSNFVYDDAGTTRSPTIHMIGSTTDDSAIGLIQSYGDARNVPSLGPSQPATLNTGFYAQFHTQDGDDYNEDLGTDIENDNDVPPYDRDNYAGGDTNADSAVPVRLASCSAAQSMTTVPGFIAPCGLLKVALNELALDNAHAVTLADDTTGDGPGPISVYGAVTSPSVAIILTIASGPYRGVLAAPMGQ